MILEVKREFLPLSAIGSQWHQVSYRRTIWRFNTDTERVNIIEIKTPLGYVIGMMYCYKDGYEVYTGDFDDLLKDTTWTRELIEKAHA